MSVSHTTTAKLSTLSLHDALPISHLRHQRPAAAPRQPVRLQGAHLPRQGRSEPDRKSTRLNSSHITISYAVFCLKKKNTQFTRPAECIEMRPADTLLSCRTPTKYI